MSLFDPNAVEYSTDFSPIPEGNYAATIVKVEEKPTKEPGGAYLNLQYEINDGEQAGRKFFDIITFKHPNEKTVNIACQSLKRICETSNLGPINDWQELVMATANVSLVHEEYNNKVSAKVKYYMTPEEFGNQPKGDIVKRTVAHQTPGTPPRHGMSVSADEPPF